MRIGLFSDTYPPHINGVATSVHVLQKALEKQGHEVFIITVQPEKLLKRKKREENIIRIQGVPTGIYDYKLTNVYPIITIKKIRKMNLDVIHSHTEFGIGIFARIFARRYKIPLVHTYHTQYEDYVHYITKGYFLKSGKKIVKYLTKFYCDKTATEVIVPTKKTYDLLHNKYKIEKNIHIIPTGIEIERFYKRNIDKSEINKIKKELKIQKNDFVIIFVGRIASEKNITLLINSHKKIIQNNKNAKLIFVGDGPDKKNYEKLVKKLNLENNVIFVGKKPYIEIPIYYQLANVFATASVTETQGLTVIEAMAGSLPPVVINDESFNSIVIDNLNGCLFENEKEYIEKILKLINNKKIVKELGEQARVNAESYSSKYYALRALDVYEKAIENYKERNRGFLRRLFRKLSKPKTE